MELSTDPTAPLQPARISRRQYERMIEADVFGEDDKVELLNGVLVAMSPQGFRHHAVVRRLTKLLVRLCGDDADVSAQLPFAATSDSMPEPDLCVIPPGSGDHAFARRALLVVEVAESSLQKVRKDKAAIYARSGVREYWVVDTKRQVVEILTDPVGDQYRASRLAKPGDRIELLELPNRSLAVTDIFPW